jgi:hypothetical protein
MRWHVPRSPWACFRQATKTPTSVPASPARHNHIFPFFRRRKGYRKTRKINHHVTFAILHSPNSLPPLRRALRVASWSPRLFAFQNHISPPKNSPEKSDTTHPLSSQELKARQRNVSNVFEIDKGVSKTQKLPLTPRFSLNHATPFRRQEIRPNESLKKTPTTPRSLREVCV